MTETENMCVKIFYCRDTFRIFFKSDGNDVALTSGPVSLHSDLAYYDYTVGVSTFVINTDIFLLI